MAMPSAGSTAYRSDCTPGITGRGWPQQWRSELAAETERQLKELILLAQDGDMESYRSLLRGLVPVITEFFLERTDASTKNLESLVEETLVAVHLRLHTYRPEHSLMRWICAIADHKLSTSREDRSRKPIESIRSSARRALTFFTRRPTYAEGN